MYQFGSYLVNTPLHKPGDIISFKFSSGNFVEGKTYMVTADDFSIVPNGDTIEITGKDDYDEGTNNNFVFTVNGPEPEAEPEEDT